jgi:deoxyribodipyrimidine photo-lyase
MLDGLVETEHLLKKRKIPFFLVIGNPHEAVADFIEDYSISAVVTDFDPLKIKKKQNEKIISIIEIDFYEVDAHNIVPCWEASSKKEYAAYTIRPKIKKKLKEFLEDFPEPEILKMDTGNLKTLIYQDTDWEKVKKSLGSDRSVPEIKWLKPGYENAIELLDNFLKKKIYNYSALRNDPNMDAQSDLSPYLHSGQISAQRVVLEISKLDIKAEIKDHFLDELIIRRELSDNFCFYDEHYDSFECYPDWAKETLNIHRSDKRPYIYSLENLENARTHDELWNASQMQMAKSGKMHGYLRMYWAKKILEWTKHPEEAVEYAIYLNDRYSLDGRDPNGYAGISWSIGGLHDRAWAERDIFGKIRYMSYEGCKRKFDIDSYIKKINRL